MTNAIFFAFIGRAIEQSDNIFEIQDGYECWNLKKFTRESFIDVIQKRILPINQNVLKNYKREDTHYDMFGINEEQFGQCSWGLLIPDSITEQSFNDRETLFLINLYSPHFLYPAFHVSRFGIQRFSHGKPSIVYSNWQNQADIFGTEAFVLFFKNMLLQAQYSMWNRYYVQNWDKEDWRLFAASFLFTGLKEYDNSKNAFDWQRESADMATILEALFTAEDMQKEEIGYRLRKRIAVVLSSRFPAIEKEMKDLYKDRSSFVHGSFFNEAVGSGKDDTNDMPLPDFDKLYK